MKAREIAAGIALLVTIGCAREPAAPAQKFPVDIATIHPATPVGGMSLATTQPLAATVGQHKLRIISVPEGIERQVIDLGDRTIDAFAISPTGSSVTVGDHIGGVTSWNTATGAKLFDLKLVKYPGTLVYSPDGSRIALAAQGDPVQIIDAVSGKVTAAFGAPVGGTLTCAFAPDGSLVATGDGDSVVRVYDSHTGKLVSENHDFLMVPLAVAFSADGTSVIAGSGDKVLIFIDTKTGKATRKLDRATQPVSAIDKSPDGKSIVTMFMKSENMTEPDHVLVRTMDSGAVELDWLPPAMPIGGAWMSDGRLLLAVPAPDGIHLWRLK